MNKNDPHYKIYREIGGWLRNLRRRAGFSVRRTAKKTGYSGEDIEGWEKTGVVSSEVLEALLNLYTTDLSVLLVKDLNELISSCLLMALADSGANIGQMAKALNISEKQAEQIFETPFLVPASYLMALATILNVSLSVRELMDKSSLALAALGLPEDAGGN